MGLNYLLDSNVIIDHFGEKLPESTVEILETNEIFTATVSQIEVLGFKMDENDELKFLDFFNKSTNFELDQETINQADFKEIDQLVVINLFQD